MSILRILILWLVLAGVCAGIGLIVFNPLENYDLATTGVEIKATITAKEPQNHGVLHYSYTVAGEKYDSVGRSGYGNPNFYNISIGQEVVAFYDPKKPSRSTLGNPNEHVKGNVRIVIAIVVIAPLFVGYVMYRRLPRLRRWLRATNRALPS